MIVLKMWIRSFRLFDINWQELTLYYNNDIIEMTYKCSLELLEFFSVEEQNAKRDVENRLMNILVIGKGFDLAHGLPTKYGDFLEFCKNEIREKGREYRNVCRKWRDIFNIKGYEVVSLVQDNIWVDYFLASTIDRKENWIDFESEISKVIREIDDDMHGLSDVYKLRDEIKHISNGFLNKQFYGLQITYRELRDRLLFDLYKLIRALELYLCHLVESIDYKGVLPDIKEISFDKILSSNYTDTYRKIYDPNELSEYDYIHGKIDLEHSFDTNNMVLGIDEYLSKKRKNKDVEFIAFKKYYQRIYKETGCKYKEWVDDIRSDIPIRDVKFTYMDECNSEVYQTKNLKFHNLYIFGHSLDVTDKDILRDLILNEMWVHSPPLGAQANFNRIEKHDTM